MAKASGPDAFLCKNLEREGTGFHLFVDEFYTQRDSKVGIWASAQAPAVR